jgi:hypothetical protein
MNLCIAIGLAAMNRLIDDPIDRPGHSPADFTAILLAVRRRFGFSASSISVYRESTIDP